MPRRASRDLGPEIVGAIGDDWHFQWQLIAEAASCSNDIRSVPRMLSGWLTAARRSV